MIGGQPCEKKGREQRAGHDPQDMHAGVAKELAPSCRIRNQASDAANSFRPERIYDEFGWLKTFKNEKKKQNNAESEKRVNMEERNRGKERQLDPEGQRPGTPTFSTSRALAKERFAPMPEQKHAGRNCVKQSALSHKHGERYAFPGDRCVDDICLRALII